MLFLDNLCETVSKCKISFPWQFREVLITINTVNIEMLLTYPNFLNLVYVFDEPIPSINWDNCVERSTSIILSVTERKKRSRVTYITFGSKSFSWHTLICLFRCQLYLQETFQSNSYFIHGVNVCGVSPVKVNFIFIIGIDKCHVQANPWAWHIFNHGWSNWHKKWRHACQQEKF